MLTLQYKTPGVYREDVFPTLPAELRTGVPAFLGLAEKGPVDEQNKPLPQMLTHWPEFEKHFGKPLPNSYLAYAVRGFFANDGRLCYVIRLEGLGGEALDKGLAALAPLDTIDLVCAPDIMTNPAQALELQQKVLDHCEHAGDRFAILDSLPRAKEDKVEQHVQKVLDQRRGLSGTNGALYFPWIDVGERDEKGEIKDVPPCGHVAGIYARSDERIGVHKAPANEVLEGVLDLEVNLTDAQQGQLNPHSVNCLRAFPGRGIRVWGARTLSSDPAWTYVNVRRLFLTAGRWIERNMADTAFEPHDLKLWARINRELTTYFNGLFQRGALKGRTPQEAFYVKCDAETNPAEVRDAGQVVTEIGFAPAVPNEFVVVRIIHGPSGITIAGPAT
jgi:hypothetical protein